MLGSARKSVRYLTTTLGTHYPEKCSIFINSGDSLTFVISPIESSKRFPTSYLLLLNRAILVMKNLFDAQSEESGGPESERQARIELARLDCVDGLPGHIKGVGQLGLRPVTLGAQHLEPVLHRYRHVPNRLDTANVKLMRISRYAMSAWKGITW